MPQVSLVLCVLFKFSSVKIFVLKYRPTIAMQARRVLLIAFSLIDEVGWWHLVHYPDVKTTNITD